MPPPPEEKRAPRTWAWIGIGVGSTAVVTGAVLGFAALTTYRAAEKNHCVPAGCTDEGLSIIDDSRALALGSTFAFAIGGLALAGGIVLLFAGPRSTPVNLTVGPGSLRLRKDW